MISGFVKVTSSSFQPCACLSLSKLVVFVSGHHVRLHIGRVGPAAQSAFPSSSRCVRPASQLLGTQETDMAECLLVATTCLHERCCQAMSNIPHFVTAILLAVMNNSEGDTKGIDSRRGRRAAWRNGRKYALDSVKSVTDGVVAACVG